MTRLSAAAVLLAAAASLTVGVAAVSGGPQRQPDDQAVSSGRASGPLPDLVWAAQVGGGIGGLAATADEAGHRLFVGLGSRLEVYDVADADRPVRVGTSTLLPAQVQAMRVDDGHLYAALNRGGFYVFDIDSGLAPRLAGRLPGVTGSVAELELQEGYAFLADRATGLVVVDVHNPERPELVGTTTFRRTSAGGEPLRPRALAGRGSELALVAADTTPGEAGTHELILLDASSPSHPRERGRVRFEASNPDGLVWQGDSLYLGTNRGALVLDVAEPSAPRVLGLVAPGEGLLVGRLHAGPDRLYQWAGIAGGHETALVEYAFEGPSTLRVVAVHRNGPFGGLHVHGGRIYSNTSNIDGQLAIYETAGTALVRHAALELPGLVGDGAWADDVTWLLGNGGLFSLPTDGPDGVEPIFRLPLAGTRMAVSRERLYVAAGRSGLRTIDVHDPAAPRELAPIPLSPPSVDLRNVAVADDRAYAIAWRGRSGLPSDLWVLDVMRAEETVVMGSLPLLVGWNGMAQLAPVGDMLLVSSDTGPSSREIIVVDVRDVAAPREVYRLRLPEHVWAFAVAPDRAIYVGTSDGLLALELVQEPIGLVERARWRAGTELAPRAVLGLTLRGDRIAVLVGFPPADGAAGEGADPLGHEAAMRELHVLPDGRIEAGSELPVAATLGTNASYRLFPAGPYVGMVGAYVGLNLVRDDVVSGPGAILLPFVAKGAPTVEHWK